MLKARIVSENNRAPHLKNRETIAFSQTQEDPLWVLLKIRYKLRLPRMSAMAAGRYGIEKSITRSAGTMSTELRQ